MSTYGIEYDDLSRLLRLVENQGLDELVVEEDDQRIVIRGANYSKNKVSRIAIVTPPPNEEEHSSGQAQSVVINDGPVGSPVYAPMVGVFYRAPGPDQSNYVEVGDHIEVGQIIGVIEAMKVFSEIPTEVSGTVVSISANNAQLVKPTDVLMTVAPA